MFGVRALRKKWRKNYNLSVAALNNLTGLVWGRKQHSPARPSVGQKQLLYVTANTSSQKSYRSLPDVNIILLLRSTKEAFLLPIQQPRVRIPALPIFSSLLLSL